MNLDFSHITVIIAALITGIASPIVVQFFQYYFKKRMQNRRKHTLDNNSALKTDSLITSKLYEILTKFKCNRVSVSEFHNGVRTYSGKSFQKFSTTYEVVSDGVSTEALHTQNIPTSIFSDFFQELESSPYLFCKDINHYGKRKEVSVHISVQNFFKKRGTTSFLCCQIKDIQSNFVGFLCIEGVHHELNLSDHDIDLIVLASSNLAGYLEE